LASCNRTPPEASNRPRPRDALLAFSNKERAPRRVSRRRCRRESASCAAASTGMLAHEGAKTIPSSSRADSQRARCGPDALRRAPHRPHRCCWHRQLLRCDRSVQAGVAGDWQSIRRRRDLARSSIDGSSMD
jgi:hypothetical protein